MDVVDITAPEIRSELLRIQSKRRERQRTWLECIRLAYDAIAGYILSSGKALDDHALRVLIPGAVLKVAAGYQWIENPWKKEEFHRRHVYDPYAWIPQDHYAKVRVLVDIPEAELTVELGSCKLTPEKHQWWLDLLESRILEWEATFLEVVAQRKASVQVPPKSSEPKRRGQKATASDCEQRGAIRRAVVEPALKAQKPKGWSINFWASKAGLNDSHAAYRYMDGKNISRDSYQKLGAALGLSLPE